MTEPNVAVVVVSHNTREDLLRCLQSLRDHAGMAYEAVVVDNASTDGSAEAVRRERAEVTVVEPGANLGFAAACNLGLEACRAPLVLFLNSDALIRTGTLARLVDALHSDSELALVGPRTLNDDGTTQVSFGPELSIASEWGQRRLVRGVAARDPAWLAEAERLSLAAVDRDWVSGSCMLARREALAEVEGFDAGYFLYEEDVDLCRRLRLAGWRIGYVPDAVVVHRLGRSMRQSSALARLEYHRSHLRYYDRHAGVGERLALRALVATVAAAGWLRAAVRGEACAAEREHQATVLQLVTAPNAPRYQPPRPAR